MEWLTLLLIGVLIVLLISYTTKTSTPPGFKSLPGPVGLPIVGYLPFLGSRPYATFAELGKKYGPLFQLRLGGKPVVVLNSREAIQEAFVKDWKFTGRPQLSIFEIFLEVAPGGFSVMSGDKWKFLRKNSMKALSLFAASKSSRLQKVADWAAEKLIATFSESVGKPIDPQLAVFDCASSVIGSICYGGQFDSSHSLIQNMLKVTEVFNDAFDIGSLIDYLPLGWLLLKHKTNKLLKLGRQFMEPINFQIENHQCNAEVTDVADALARVSREATDEELRAAGVSRDLIRYASQDLFSAGFQTTMETFLWSLNILALEQTVQAKLHEELKRVLQGQQPTLNDRNRLPYTEAILLEVLRFSSLVPLMLPHSTLEDTELFGYFVPKETIVLPNAWAVHHDETTFKKPYEFDPDRFLSGDGRELDPSMTQMILPFGSGKRRCVGENLARQDLFLLLASVFQRFQVDPATGEHIDLSASKTGFTRAPMHYKLVFKQT